MRYDADVETSSDVISLVNAEGKVLYASASSAKLFGYLPEELIGRSAFDLIHPEDRDYSHRALFAVIAEPTTPRHVEIRILRKDGALCWAEGTVSNLLDEPRIGAIVINCRAIGARRAAERQQTEKLIHCNRQLEDCLNAVGHDFKEPLRTISMFTSLLLKSVELDTDARLLAQHIVSGVTRMASLFDGLHALAAAGDDDPAQPVHLNLAVAEALHDLSHAITTSGATVTVEPLPFVLGSRNHLLRVFQNLIANAVKYRSVDPIKIHITAEPAGPDWIVKVGDNGVGIASEDHERIFLLLKRLHGPEIPGAGIGLAICKKVIEEMGGSIWVESDLGSGSTFCFTIAAAKETATAHSTVSQTDPCFDEAVSKSVAARPDLTCSGKVKLDGDGR